MSSILNKKFEFINHSSFCVSNNDLSLLVDPWISGSVFNCSWDLLSPTNPGSIKTIDKSKYVWFSHEHPDHFNPKNIIDFLKGKNFLFQKTKDKRVVNFLKNISSNVYELDSNKDFHINDKFSIRVIPFQDIDSFCLIKIDDITILNLNDCDIKSEDELLKIKNYSGNIDILMGQFSYAIGKTNKNQSHLRKIVANEILNNLSKTISFFKPKYFIPFASFCFFSRFDNFYLNDSINNIDSTIKMLKSTNPETKFLCFYPGDIWDFHSEWDNNLSIEKYLYDYKKIIPSNCFGEKKIDFETLLKASINFIKITKDKNNLFKFYHFFNSKFYNIYFKLTDLNIILYFDFNNGLKKIDNINNNNQYCELGSNSLLQLFSSGYGYDALTIGGRFECDKNGMKALNKIFKFQTKNYQNEYYKFSSIIPRLLKKLFKYSRVNSNR